MPTTNDITGDALRSKPNNDKFNENFDRIFGSKSKLNKDKKEVKK